MLRAVMRSWEDGFASTVVIGADAPTTPRGLVLDAFRRLAAGARAVVSPSDDGGYVLIGVGEPDASAFWCAP